MMVFISKEAQGHVERYRLQIGSEKSVQQGQRPMPARSIRTVREYLKLAKTPLADFPTDPLCLSLSEE